MSNENLSYIITRLKNIYIVSSGYCFLDDGWGKKK